MATGLFQRRIKGKELTGNHSDMKEVAKNLLCVPTERPISCWLSSIHANLNQAVICLLFAPLSDIAAFTVPAEGSLPTNALVGVELLHLCVVLLTSVSLKAALQAQAGVLANADDSGNKSGKARSAR